MRCEWRQLNCFKDATRQLVITHSDRDSQHICYYCEAHALMRLSELETDASVTILAADEVERPSRNE